MNVAFGILWILVIIVFIILILMLQLQVKKVKLAKGIITYETQEACQPLPSMLPSVSDLQCCVIGGKYTPNKYFREINMVVSPNPTYYKTACSGFCRFGTKVDNDEKCAGNASQIGNDQEEYDECLALTKPIDCSSPAMPIAIDGIQYYYALSATNAECQATFVCSEYGF